MPPLMSTHSNQYETSYNYDDRNIFTDCGCHENQHAQPNKKRRLNPLTHLSSNNKKKQVTFAPYLMTHKSTKTQEEVTSSWYSQEEMEILKQERNDFIKACRKVQWNLDALDPNQHFMRGFEAYSSQQLNRDLRARREFVVKRVKEEQQRQRLKRKDSSNKSNEEQDEESIRAVSMAISQQAQNRALELGVQDAEESWTDTLLDMESMALAADCGDDENDAFDYSMADEFATLIGHLPLQPLPC